MEGVTRGQLGDHERAAHKPPNEMKQVQGGCGEAQPDALSHGTFVNRLYGNAVPQTSLLREEERGIFFCLLMVIGQSLPHGALSPHVGFWEAAGEVRSPVLLHGASSKSRRDGRIRVFKSLVCSWTWAPELPGLLPWQVQQTLCLIPASLQGRQRSQHWGAVETSAVVMVAGLSTKQSINCEWSNLPLELLIYT